MGLNIKNEDTHRLIRELASLTGESQSAAVDGAVRERLQRVQKKQDLLERIMAIADDAAPRFKEPYRSADHGDLLYDENGLPK